MLPGFRFLCSAILLSMSVLIFGLGAAALLRSAHEEFANLPSRRATPEPMFARLSDDQPPTLALLQVDPVPDQPAVANTPPSQPPETGTVEPEKLASLTSAEPPQGETTKPEELPRQAGAELAAAPDSGPVEAEPPPDNSELKTAAVSAPEPDAATLPEPSPQPTDIPTFEPSIATTVIATLGGPAVQIEHKASAAEAKPVRHAAKKRQAERARERRRMAAIRRARLAREAALTLQQQQPNPFAFPLAPATR